MDQIFKQSEFGFERLYRLPDTCFSRGGKVHDGFRYLKSGESVAVSFSGKDIDRLAKNDRSYRLRLIGEVDIHPLWRTEKHFPSFYRLIDDSLCSEMTHHSRFSLKLSATGEDFPRAAFAKVGWSEIEQEVVRDIHSGAISSLTMSIWCKREAITLLPGGSLEMVAEVFYLKDGKHPRDVSETPDAVYRIDLGEGTCDWERRSVNIPLEETVACLLISISGRQYTGDVWMEDPCLEAGDYPNMLPQFAPAAPFSTHTSWTGCNLSHKEWASFRVEINGHIAAEGERFQRIYRWPVSEFEIPCHVLHAEQNEMTVTLESDYREPLPYKLRAIEFVSRPGDFDIVSCPDLVTTGESFGVIIQAGKPGMKVQVSVLEGKHICAEQTEFMTERQGLNVIPFRAERAGGHAVIELRTESGIWSGTVERVVERGDDHVLTGTSDPVYIDSAAEEMAYFLAWYMNQQIGNMVTFRPIYRWSGTRMTNESDWTQTKRLCEKLGLDYALIIENRELPGCNANPTLAVLEGEKFLGSQAHERDGFSCYWGARPGEEIELFSDLMSRMSRIDGNIVFHTPVRTTKGIYRNLDPHTAEDMEQAALQFINNIGIVPLYASRHTGPSVLFKYLYRAGISWLGAELMYGPHEVIISALRGSSRAYKRESFGAHLAVQWSTTPHDSEQRYQRYRLALYVCYINGIDQINTEEGLWRLEERFADLERFSPACRRHTDVQRQFFRFVRSHTRRGRLHTPMAFVHGQHDGWQCFVRGQVWAQHGEEWAFAAPEESWDLLQVFYPRSVLSDIYSHPCPNESNGFYTGTPYGVTDIVPVEADNDVLGQYTHLALLGWNTADSDQLRKWIQFVDEGGTLLLGLPHLFACKKRSEAFGECPVLTDALDIQQLIGADIQGYHSTKLDTGEMLDIGKLDVRRASILLRSADGDPLLLEHRFGRGRVYFVNAKAYPSDSRIREVYERMLHRIGKSILEKDRESGWLIGTPDIGFTVYDRENGLRVIYTVNINWWDDSICSKETQLLWGTTEIPVEVNREHIGIITLKTNVGVMTSDNETDVVDLQEDASGARVAIQGSGETELVVLLKRQEPNLTLYAETLSGEALSVCRMSSPYSWKLNICLHGRVDIVVRLVEN